MVFGQISAGKYILADGSGDHKTTLLLYTTHNQPEVKLWQLMIGVNSVFISLK
jgi:hypothetical protein